MSSALTFESVTKRFGAVTAIDQVSFSIARGETVALLGPSGCGKTTILRVIAGFEVPDEGNVHIADQDMTRRRPYERNVGLLFQHYALFPHLTVEQNIAYGLRHRGFPKADIPGRVVEMLSLVKLPGYADRYPSQLSGGQQQRVALGRALATRPEVVLLDEPLSALDAKLRQELRAELKDVLAAVGSTSIVVTHDQEEAMSLGERIFVMNAGDIIQQGPPDSVYSRPCSRFVAEFMGRSNWFAGRPVGREGNSLQFETTCGLTLLVSDPAVEGAAAYDICVRPESIEVLPHQPLERIPGRNVVAGIVRETVLLGAARQVLLELPSGRSIVVIQPNRADIACTPGQAVIASFSAAECILVPMAASGMQS